MNAYDLYTFYIEPADLKGQTHKVKVESVEVAELFNPGRKKSEKKIVLHLAGKKKALSLNKTRTKQMIDLTGTPEIEQWAGAEIVIEPGKQSGKDTIFIKAPQQTVTAPKEQAQPSEPDIQLIDPLDKESVAYAAEKWGIAEEHARKTIKEMDLGNRFDKTEFEQIIAEGRKPAKV